jgi:hypothetical protein
VRFLLTFVFYQSYIWQGSRRRVFGVKLVGRAVCACGESFCSNIPMQEDSGDSSKAVSYVHTRSFFGPTPCTPYIGMTRVRLGIS